MVETLRKATGRPEPAREATFERKRTTQPGNYGVE